MSVGDRLSLLHRRTFVEEIAEVDRLARSPDPAGELLKAIDAWQQEGTRWSDTVDRLVRALGEVAPVQTQALLAAWLRRHAPIGRLAGDLAALGRNLGVEAIRERSIAARDRLGTLTEFALVALLVALEEDTERRAAAGARLRRTLRTHERIQTRRRAAACLVDLLALEPDAPWATSVARELVATARSRDTEVWLRRQAVRVLIHLDAGAREEVVRELAGERSVDGALVREAAVTALEHCGDRRFVDDHLADPAEVVRFRAVEVVVAQGTGHRLKALVGHPDPRTRAWFADRVRACPEPDGLLARLASDPEDGVVRFALLSGIVRARRGPVSEALIQAAGRACSRDAIVVRRAAERLLAWVAHQASPARAMAEPLARMGEGERRVVRLPLGVEPLDLAVALRPFALEGFGFTLRPGRRGVRVTRGERFTVTAWRVLHEVRNPAPAKRQGHTHAVGPRLEGPIQIPPLGLAEQSATGVPGQRVQVDAGDWGAHVPTLDDYRRSLRWGRSLVVSSSGILEIVRPRSLWGRLRARTLLFWRYDSLDQERLAAVEQHQLDRYRRRFEGLGFGHAPRARSVGGFLPYLLGTSGNTLAHLAVMLGVFWTLLYGANVWLRARVRRHRRRLGLVVGGWGTRGKSGTERIKAGMLTGVGVHYVSKTTGCEAMILHGPRGGRVHEIFLFRPFDKATIWEQADVVRFAAEAGARAMIWECMALNPRYVDILQRGWMRDDMSTLTNAYPDHEDVMGPTGMDVARVIGSFAPTGSTVFTAEENMFPALAAQAERFGSHAVPLSAAEKELLPRELLGRFPYEEHPSNIALAARVSTELGIPRVEAIGWMADHVIPDLGALMVYPEVPIDGRLVTFVNAHSANDELSFTHSWRHTGMADHRLDRSPERWLVGLVNNRADRVPRSRVFARMVVRVAGAHRFLVIGTNLSGFLRFVEDAIAELLQGLDLAHDDTWDRWSEHLKIPDPRGWLFWLLRQRALDPGDLLDAFVALEPASTLEGAERQVASLDLSLVEDEVPEVLSWVRSETAWWLWLRGAVEPTQRRAFLERRLRERVHLHGDPSASGDEVVAAAVALVPPGLPMRMMGMQNIKGTGLDFVYQWQRWGLLHQDLETLDDEAIQRFGVKRLTSVFHCDAVLRALEGRAGAGELAERVQARRDELLALRTATPSGSVLGRALRRWLWRAYDPFDAVWRRRRARQVLSDLSMARIGHDEAEQILAGLTYRQKPR